MPRYVVTVKTERKPEDVFDYLSDLRNFAEWDPGVDEVELVSGTAGGGDAVYDVTVNGSIRLRYEVTEFTPGHRAKVIADNGRFRSVDVITVERAADGSLATYDAELTFSGRMGGLSFLLAPVFNRIGDKAGEGLRSALGGSFIDA